MKLSNYANVLFSGYKINEVPKVGYPRFDSDTEVVLSLADGRYSPDIFHLELNNKNVNVNFEFANDNKIFLLMVKSIGTSSITFPSEMRWSGGNAPTLTADSVDCIHISKINDDVAGTSYTLTGSVQADVKASE